MIMKYYSLRSTLQHHAGRREWGNEGLISELEVWMFQHHGERHRERLGLKASAPRIETATATRLDGKVSVLTHTYFRSHGNLNYANFAYLVFAGLSVGGVLDSSKYLCSHRSHCLHYSKYILLSQYYILYYIIFYSYILAAALFLCLIF